MSIADTIRDYVYNQHVKPAVSRGDKVIRVRAGDIHRKMNLHQRHALVCSAIGGIKFQNQYHLELVNRTGPKQGANVFFEFKAAKASGIRAASAPRNSRQELPARKKTAAPAASQIAPLAGKDVVYLVSCVSAKRDAPCLAKDLYISDWFLKARHYVEGIGRPWFILSARYGLVRPEQKIAPYDVTLNTMRIADRKEWAETVLGHIEKLLPTTAQVAFLAGQRYREFLAGVLEDKGVRVSIPMEGLRIGEQLAWLDANTQSRR